MTENKRSKRPSHSVFVVEGEGDSAYWTKVGAMWPHENGKGFNLSLSCIPLNGRLVICEAKTDRQVGEQERGR